MCTVFGVTFSPATSSAADNSDYYGYEAGLIPQLDRKSLVTILCSAVVPVYNSLDPRQVSSWALASAQSFQESFSPVKYCLKPLISNEATVC